MASLDDVLSGIKGATQNIGELVAATQAPGLQGARTQTSPVASYLSVGTSAIQVIGFRSTRRAISFHNSGGSTGTTIWLAPNSIATGQGLFLAAGSSVFITPDLGCTCGWTAIAGTGSSNGLMILEYI